jgi:iron complex transport system substrate-binding protein
MISLSRRALLGTAVALPTFGSLSLAGAQTPEATPGGGLQENGTWVYTDSTGKVITFPEVPTPVIAQTTSAAALWDLGYQVAAIYGPALGADGNPDGQAGNIDLEAVEYLGDYGALDMEMVALISPQLYVDVDRGNGVAWYAQPDIQEEFDARVETLLIQAGGISVLETINHFESLATALGADLTAPEVVAAKDAWRVAEDAFKAAVAAKPGLRVLATSPSPTDFYIVNPDFTGDLIYLKSLGLDLIPTPDPDPASFNNFQITTWEEVGVFTDDADVILVDIRNAPDWADGIDFWQTLPAVAAGQVGAWNGVFPFTYEGLTTMLTAMTATIDAANVLE